MTISRLIPVAAAAAALAVLSGCTTTTQRQADASAAVARVSAFMAPQVSVVEPAKELGPVPLTAYSAMEDNGFKLPAIPIEKVPPEFRRQRVVYHENYAPGTIVVDTPHRFLYVVEAGGTAMRYGIGVGKEGFSWAGKAYIGDKQQWPKWFPPKEMIERDKKLEPYTDGMNGGPQNPLGARALYLYQGRRDTLYRLHGSPEWRSIGKAASSGCIRLMNQDIIDLYDRVPVDAQVVVLQGGEKMVQTQALGPIKVAADQVPPENRVPNEK